MTTLQPTLIVHGDDTGETTAVVHELRAVLTEVSDTLSYLDRRRGFGKPWPLDSQLPLLEDAEARLHRVVAQIKESHHDETS